MDDASTLASGLTDSLAPNFARAWPVDMVFLEKTEVFLGVGGFIVDASLLSGLLTESACCTTLKFVDGWLED